MSGPVTGSALTQAQRKRKSREMAATALFASTDEGGKPLHEIPLTALLEQFAKCHSAAMAVMAGLIADELKRRADLLTRD